jgi:hypothetical protein
MSVIPKEGKIEVVTGDLGAGKTAYVVELIYEQLCQGGWVFTNIELYADKIAERMHGEGLIFDPTRLVILSGESMRDFHTQIRRGADGEVVMVAIDEAHFDLAARDYRSTSDEFIQFVTLCRKLDIWLVFLTQDGDDIDKVVRKKFTVETLCRNLKEERIAGVPFPFSLYVRVSFKLQKGRVHHKLDAHYVSKPTSWGLYNSKALLGAKAAAFAKMHVARKSKLARVQKPVTSAAYYFAAAAAAAVVLIP